MSDIPPPFTLSESERRSSLWLRLSSYMTERRAILRGKNDDDNLTPTQTASIRGQLKCLKGLIELGDEPPSTAETRTHGNARPGTESRA